MLESGQTLGHFKIVRKLGEGGMGEVYLAEDQKLTRHVAIKTLSNAIFEDSERQQRFYREARTAAQISHPNVMSIFEIDSAKDPASGNDLNYIVMEYVRGKPLGDYIRENSPDMPKMLRLAEKIAAGLSSAHQMNIVHRDIKFENVIVDDDGNPKILDFGLAKPIDAVKLDEKNENGDTISEDLTKAGKILGTISFMSPEQVQGKPVDSRSDIFAFGILLYRMLTGEAPFKGETQVSTMAKILETPHESPRRRNPNIPPELERIVDKCLRKDPGDRYQDTRDLVVDLRNLRRDFDSGVTGAISAVSDAAQGTRKGFLSGRRVAAFSIVAAFLLIVLAFGSGVFDGLRSLFSAGETSVKTLQNSLAIIGFENKTGEPELNWLETGLPEILLTDLSQTRDIHIFSQQRILDCFPMERRLNHTHEQSVDAARSLGASRLLSGTFFKLGDKIRIDARLEDVKTGQIILGEKVIGDDPFVLVDSLTAKVANALDLTETSSVTRYTSSSPEAFKQYHLGMEFFWANEYDSAIERFNQAIAIDSIFALPYMRIGMAYVFQGRQTEGARYLALARQHEEKLPIRERNLLDAYSDLWVDQNFDHAFAKFSSMLRDYPDDPEIRTIYALFVEVFQRDSTAAFANLDTVLIKYPTYPFALEQYAQLKESHEDYTRAIDFTERLRGTLPDAIAPKYRLARLYMRQGRFGDARKLAEQLARDYPNDERPLARLITLAIYDRDFDAADQYVEQLRRLKPDDAYHLVEYYDYKADLAMWRGQFDNAMNYRFERLKQARITGDSVIVFAAYSSISNQYERFKMTDSAVYYSEQAHRWANPLNKISYAFTLVNADTANIAKARPMVTDAITEFRSRFPREFWGVINHLEELFNAYASADTAALIEAYGQFSRSQGQKANADVFRKGLLQVLAGQPKAGIETLSIFVAGPYVSTSAWVYLNSCYYIGRAQQALGRNNEAVANYREVLKFWSNPDHDHQVITDSRERLSKLTS
jgi:TolB-like protein/tetratricopeptide (TPR) repeat protein/tRNA A-37 threonylcarbamoyl transferase component Bud32